jgi:folate-dependent phosphoribosylglycinamide formyltransferase PurN
MATKLPAHGPLYNPTACFAGTRIEAFMALGRYSDIKGIITVPGSRVHQYCLEAGRQHQLIRKEVKEEIYSYLAREPFELVLSAGFPFIMPGSVLSSGAIFINSHPSLLPAYKGYDAIRPAVENRDEYIGVTVHSMVEEMDAGPQIYQEKVWVKGLDLRQVYDLIFGVVEPLAITKSMEIMARQPEQYGQ